VRAAYSLPNDTLAGGAAIPAFRFRRFNTVRAAAGVRAGGAVGWLGAGGAEFELVRPAVVVERTFSQGELQLQILNLGGAKGGLGQAIPDVLDQVFKIYDMRV